MTAPTRAEALAEWWIELAATEAAEVVDKAVEYGATDLVDIGTDLVRGGFGVLPLEECSPGQLAEMGIYFYLRGKFARWTAAIADGRPVSNDTLKDIGVYVRMAQRVREVGEWPGV